VSLGKTQFFFRDERSGVFKGRRHYAAREKKQVFELNLCDILKNTLLFAWVMFALRLQHINLEGA